MKFCCASNAAIKNFKIARKKINFFPNCFCKIKITDFFLKNNIYFRILEVLPVILSTYSSV